MASVERVILGMVANWLSPTPLSKLVGCAWVARRAFIDGLAEVGEHACYRATDFRLGELQEEGFFAAANLLNLEAVMLFCGA